MRSLREFAGGIGFFFQGLAWVARNGRWWAFGLIPALIAFAVYVAALVYLGNNANDIADFLTPFADGWSEGWRDFFRGALGVLLFIGGLALAVVTFTALTLTIGEPFYEKLSEKVDPLDGPDDTPWWRSLPRSLRDSLVTLLYVLMFTIPLFLLGFVPVIGQTVVPVLGALVSGFFLTVELTALAMERRGMRRRDRFAVLRGNKAPALGFGVLVFLLFLMPLVAVIAMPAAVAGAALMVRSRLTPPSPTGLPGTGLPGAGPRGTGLPGAGSPGTGRPGPGPRGAAMPGTPSSPTGLPDTGSPPRGMPPTGGSPYGSPPA
ncbi:EI24 domain-containing protein [Nonomuraea dietziae]|uniref:EI24 domain-containing protein n=1 Tax=Nonomuraea dietziae TaxID=65515 RepID=UPI0033D45F6D